MSLKYSIPSIETLKDTPTQRVLLSIRDNLAYINSRYLGLDDLINYKLVKKNKNGSYSVVTSSSSTGSDVDSSVSGSTGTLKVIINGDGMGIGVHNMSASLPARARVVYSFYEVTSDFTSLGAATLGVRVKYDGTNYTDIVTEDAISTSWTTGLHAGKQTYDISTFTEKTTTYRSVETNVSSFDLTGGRAVLYIYYAVMEI